MGKEEILKEIDNLYSWEKEEVLEYLFKSNDNDNYGVEIDGENVVYTTTKKYDIYAKKNPNGRTDIMVKYNPYWVEEQHWDCDWANYCIWVDCTRNEEDIDGYIKKNRKRLIKIFEDHMENVSISWA